MIVKTHLPTEALLTGSNCDLAALKANPDAKGLLARIKDELSRQVLYSVPLREKVAKSGFERLSPRQLEALKLLAQDYSDTEIAGKMGLSKASFSTYKRKIFLKLRVHGCTEAMDKYRERILTPCRWRGTIRAINRVDSFPAIPPANGARSTVVASAEGREMSPHCLDEFIKQFGAVITDWVDAKKGWFQRVQLLKTTNLPEQAIVSMVNADFHKRWPQHKREIERRLKHDPVKRERTRQDSKTEKMIRLVLGSDEFKQWIQGNALGKLGLKPSIPPVSAGDALGHLQGAFREQLHEVQLGMRKLAMFKQIMQIFDHDQ